MTKAKTQADYKKIWSRKANKILKGLTVKKIRWMTRVTMLVHCLPMTQNVLFYLEYKE
jgi:hypothetical protein